ncbi:MAG: glycosyltransferase family 4 protein [Anaerolineales bacterium]
MRVLMIVQEIDETHWLRGFIVDWVRALAREVEQLYILTLAYQPTLLPDNVAVISMGKERGYGRARLLLEFYRGLAQTIRDVDVVFSHMTPRYTWLAAPLAWIARKPQMLWYTHRQVDLELRLALHSARWVTTATPDSFPLPSPKVRALGHGIDTRRFAPADVPKADPPLVLAVARVTPIKRHELLLQAAAQFFAQHGPQAARFEVVGGTAAPGDEDYQRDLLARREALGLSPAQFDLVGGLGRDELIARYQQATLATNLSPPGLFDKAALEAMLCGVPVIVTNPAFDNVLGTAAKELRIAPKPDNLAACLSALLSQSEVARQSLGNTLREQVAAAHSLDNLVKKLVKVP